MKHSRKSLLGTAVITAIFATSAHAQLTWDPDGDQVSNGGAGTWDVSTTANWDDDGSPPNVVWTNASDAIFGNSGANYNVSVETGSMVSVTDLTYEGTNILTFVSSLGDSMITLAGNAAWDTGGGTIQFASNQSGAADLGDVGLDLGGNTLTVSGGGTFDAGERGNGVNWGAGNLVLSDATVLRGAAYNIGLLDSVTLPDGSTFLNERNSNQTFNGMALELVSGTVSFDSRFARQTVLNGGITGAGRLEVKFSTFNESQQDYSVALNSENDFTGGVTSDGSDQTTILWINADNRLGAVPASFDPDNIILRNGGYIRLNAGSSFGVVGNRGITLDGGGGIISATDNHTVSGAITGTGPLRIGRDGDSSATQLTLNGVSDYTGGTDILKGTLNISNDSELGAVPGSLEVDNIILRDAARLKMNVGGGVNLHANRGITLDGGGTFINGSAAHTVNGPITGTGGLTIGVSGDGSGNRTILTSSANDYTGDTTLFKGSIELGTNDALPPATVVNVGGGNGGGSRLYMEGFDATIAGLQLTGSNTRELVNNGATASTLTINVPNGETPSYGGNINRSNSINIIKTGDGTQTLNRTSGYTTPLEDVTVNGGDLIWTNASGTLSGTGTLTVGASGTFQIGNGGNAGTIGNEDITNDGSVIFNRDNGSTITYGGVISGTGSVTYTGGSGAVILNAAQTYTGDTIIDKKQLSAGVIENALSSESVIRIGGTGTGNAIFQLKGNNQQAGGLVAGADSQSKDIRNDSGTVSLTLDVATGQSYDYAANVQGGGTINIVKTGEGSQSFTRGGGYSSNLGSITVNEGDFIWNATGGASNQTGAVTVTTAGTLGGTGTLGGALAVNSGGTLAPGTSVGTLTASSTVDFGAGSVFEVELDSESETTDLLVSAAAVTIDPAATLSVSDIAGAPTALPLSTKLAIIDYTGGSLSGAFSGLPEGSTLTIGLNTFQISYVDGSMVTLTAVSAGGSVYDAWAAGFAGLTDTEPTLDFDLGGLQTGVEYVVGGDPTDSSDDVALAPTAEDTGSALVFTYRRTDLANNDPGTSIYVEYGSDLMGWDPAVHGTDGVTITENDDHYDTGVDQVIVSLPYSLTATGKLFCRLQVEQP